MNVKQLNWPQIIVTSVVGAIATVITGTILFRLQTREPLLVYSTTDTIPFSGQNQVVAIYQVSVSNEGKKVVEDVDCHINVPGAMIEQKRISASPTISYSASVISDTLGLHIRSLNPSELVQLSLLASAPSDLPARPEVSLRGKGVSGVEKSTQESGFSLSTSLLAGLAGLLAALATLSQFSSAVEQLFGLGRHSGDQRQILAYLCSLHGLTEEAEHLLAQPQETSYWFESDKLSELALKSGEPKKVEKIKSVLKDLLDYAEITSDSKAIILYNLARIEGAEEDFDRMREYLKRAKAKAPKTVGTRLKIDPVFREIRDPLRG